MAATSMAAPTSLSSCGTQREKVLALGTFLLLQRENKEKIAPLWRAYHGKKSKWEKMLYEGAWRRGKFEAQRLALLRIGKLEDDRNMS